MGYFLTSIFSIIVYLQFQTLDLKQIEIHNYFNLSDNHDSLPFTIMLTLNTSPTNIFLTVFIKNINWVNT